jgi:hypothetical protein
MMTFTKDANGSIRANEPWTPFLLVSRARLHGMTDPAVRFLEGTWLQFQIANGRATYVYLGRSVDCLDNAVFGLLHGEWRAARAPPWSPTGTPSPAIPVRSVPLGGVCFLLHLVRLRGHTR